MSEMLPQSETARVLQISRKETITYEMPMRTYELFKDICDWWPVDHGRAKCSVERVLRIIDDALTPFGLHIWDEIRVTRKPTKPEIKGLQADVWIDEREFSEGDDQQK
jgi:hypothetical protein